MKNDITLWQPENKEIIPSSANTPAEISSYAVQLSLRDQKQIASAFDAGHYEMGINYLWGKTINALKKELSAVGIGLLGEMLGKTGVDEDDDVDDILTTRDTIRLAEELGVVNPTDAMRLRHTYELITHFSQLEINENSLHIEIDPLEANNSLKLCIRSVLGRPKVAVAKKFVEFRSALENESLSDSDTRVSMLKSSPYFFYKLTVSVLMNAAKKNTGANLEHALANINVLIPAIWKNLREAEKWNIGHTYAETYADGKTTSVGGLKSTLLKVRGFDYVPENLRSDTFVKAANSIIEAHEGLNNFYNEYSPVKNMAKLGSTIPTPALPACMTALLCVAIGNMYGTAWNAAPLACEILTKISNDRWEYYLNNVLPSEPRILNKLILDKPSISWCYFAKELQLSNFSFKDKDLSNLIKHTTNNDNEKVKRVAQKIIKMYYGRA